MGAVGQRAGLLDDVRGQPARTGGDALCSGVYLERFPADCQPLVEVVLGPDLDRLARLGECHGLRELAGHLGPRPEGSRVEIAANKYRCLLGDGLLRRASEVLPPARALHCGWTASMCR